MNDPLPTQKRSAPPTDTTSPTHALTDEELAQLIMQRHEEALRLLMIHHGPRLGTIARRILGDMATEEDIEEIVSDTYMNVWKSINTFDRHRGSMATWLSSIAAYAALRRRRNLARRRTLQNTLAKDRSDIIRHLDNDSAHALHDRMESLAHALQRLKVNHPREADVVIRKFYRDQSTLEIAVDLGITTNNARVQIHRALRHMAELLTDAGYGTTVINNGGAQ